MRSVNQSEASPLLHFDAKFSSPAEHLACDEALLEICDNSALPGFLRFWESSEYFVVLGYGKDLDNEVFRKSCDDLKVPILRRCSGGGTVLQGPGCFNYGLVLPLDHAPELATISGANCLIMQRIRKALAQATGRTIQVNGYTDLALDGRKFSGNAQRRKRRVLLFHGALLLDFDLALITQTLRLPGQQPEYRASRSHGEFLTNLAVEPAAVRQALIDTWHAGASADAALRDEIERLTRTLAREKYSTRDWNERF